MPLIARFSEKFPWLYKLLVAWKTQKLIKTEYDKQPDAANYSKTLNVIVDPVRKTNVSLRDEQYR